MLIVLVNFMGLSVNYKLLTSYVNAGQAQEDCRVICSHIAITDP